MPFCAQCAAQEPRPLSHVRCDRVGVAKPSDRIGSFIMTLLILQWSFGMRYLEIPTASYNNVSQWRIIVSRWAPHLSVTHLGNRCSCCCFWSDNYTRKKKQELKARPRLGLTRNLTPQSINCRSPQNFQYDLQQPQCKLHDSSNRSQQRLHCGLKRGFQICQLPL